MDKKIRLTNQRKEIMDFMRNNYSHPSVEEIYVDVKKKLTRISKATVYQNLKFLVNNELLNEVNIKGISRFEPFLKPHHHLICRKCGMISDFESDELTKFTDKISRKIKNMDIVSANINFYGICKKCRGK